MQRSFTQSHNASAFSFNDMPLLDEDFDANFAGDDSEMLLDTPIQFVGVNDEF